MRALPAAPHRMMFFAGMLSALSWWAGYWLSRLLIFRPVGRHVELFTDTGDGSDTPQATSAKAVRWPMRQRRSCMSFLTASS